MFRSRLLRCSPNNASMGVRPLGMDVRSAGQGRESENLRTTPAQHFVSLLGLMAVMSAGILVMHQVACILIPSPPLTEKDKQFLRHTKPVSILSQDNKWEG